MRLQSISIALCTICPVAAMLACRRDDAPKSAETPPAPQSNERGSPATAKASPLFADATAESGLRFTHECGAKGDFWLPEEMGAGGALLDFDDDGDLDVYLVQGGEIGGQNLEARNRLFRNDGRGRFEDVSQGSGADVTGYGMGCAAADHDNDGDVDIFVTRLGPNILLRNEGGGKFTDVTAEAGVGDEGFGTAAAFLDYDRDGLLDLWVVNYLEWSATNDRGCYDPAGLPDYCHPSRHPPGRNFLYRNTGSGRFEDVSAAAGIAGHGGNGLGLVTTDYDNDGWVDVYVANDQTPALLFLNQKDGTFREDAAMRGAAFNADAVAIAGMGTAAEDLDEDGDYDLVITNIHSQPHLCLRNDAAMFEDVTAAWGFGGWSVPYTGFGIAFFDQDHNGGLEAYIANGAVNRLNEPCRPDNRYAEPNQFIRRGEGGRFHDASREAGEALMLCEMSRGVLRGDIDNDGDVDIIVTNNRGPAQLLRSENRSASAWVMLDLLPKGGGRHAINARVELRAAGKLFRREVRPHEGYLTSQDPRIHVGLGSASEIESLEVIWPDGSREVWPSLPVRKVLRLRQGGAPQFDPQTIAEVK